jgi:D-alanyl-D-alanine carboxypeptidase
MRRVVAGVIAVVLVASGAASSASATATRSIDKVSSYSVVVNKQRPLANKKYVPSDLVTVKVAHAYTPILRKKAAAAVQTMFKDYAKSHPGKGMKSQSAYRSYTAQVSTYNGWVSKLGKKAADLTSARPGYSEHQTGLAIDIATADSKCTLQACFASTNQGKWLAKNAYKYGFILRYPKGQTDVTGYEFEPWHYRFVGKALASDYRASGAKALEGYFDLPNAEDY